MHRNLEIVRLSDLESKAGNMACSDPDCVGSHPIILGSTCHPTSPLRVAYSEGAIAVFCSVCGNHIVSVVVGEDLPEGVAELSWEGSLQDRLRELCRDKHSSADTFADRLYGAWGEKGAG